MPRAPEEPDRAGAIRALLLAIAAYAIFLTTGLFVAHSAPGPLDLWSHVLIGHGALVAWILTWTLYMLWLAPIGLMLIVIAIVQPQWRARIIVSLVVLLVMWFAADQLQHVFMRPRRLDWIVKHETAFSYPSSHVTLAVAFYGLWAFLFLRSELPRSVRVFGAGLLVALILAVVWARLALGAHYPSDVFGGAMLGLCAASFAVAACRFMQVPLEAST